MRGKYPHNVIRLRKHSWKNKALFDVVVISNKKSCKSLGIIEKLGYIHLGAEKRTFVLNFSKLGIYLNNGAVLHKTVYKYLNKMCKK